MAHIKNDDFSAGEGNCGAGDVTAHFDAAGQSEPQADTLASTPFPEVGPAPLRVAARSGRNFSETSIGDGCIRLKVLMPFALSRLGRSYEVWDNAANALIRRDGYLRLRPFVKELASRLACGTDFIYELVSLICEKGPENVVAEDMLKQAPGGGKGTSRLSEAEEKALQDAVQKVCVEDGFKPATKAANKAIRSHLTQVGCVARNISRATIKSRSMSPYILAARTDAYQRDHLHRVAGQSDEVTGLNSVVVMDSTQFTDEDSELRVVDAQGRDLGPANVIFAILKSNRGVWSFRAFAGAANGYLAGLTIKRGLVAKDGLLKRHEIPGIWPFHGKPGVINHDNGSEFVNDQVRRVLKSRDIACVDRSPPKTPHYRASEERFNRTAHVMFDDFLGSDFGKRYLRPVKGRPQAKGILLNDLDRALVEWIVCHYHSRPNKGLGGDSPLGRMEKFVMGKNGLPASGLPTSLADTEELKWDFLCEETRVVNQLGITFDHRRYVDAALSRLFKPGCRSSNTNVNFKYHPYAMGSVYVKLPDASGIDVVHAVKWLPETEKYRPAAQDQLASINPSLWEWNAIFKDVRRGNTEKATATLAEQLFAQREAEANKGSDKAGAPGKKARRSEDRNRAMRELYGKGNVPVPADGSSNGAGQTPEGQVDDPVAQQLKPRGKKTPDPEPALLATCPGADAY